MKTIFHVFFLFICVLHGNAQVELIKKNKVSKCTVYRERFHPDTGKREIYEYVAFNKTGNIIERYMPYENFQAPLQKYYYDSLEMLIKYIGFNKKGGVYESWEWKTLTDSFDRKKHTLEPWHPNKYNWQESFNYWIQLDSLKKARIKIDTISVSAKGVNKLIRIVAIRDQGVDTSNFYFGKNIRLQTHIRHFNNAEQRVFTIKYDSEGKMIEKFPVNLTDKEPPYHFFYKYNKNGLIKEFVSKYADNRIAERLDYAYEYYKD